MNFEQNTIVCNELEVQLERKPTSRDSPGRDGPGACCPSGARPCRGGRGSSEAAAH